MQPPSQALVIGVSRYRHVGALRTTMDAIGVRDALASPSCGGYPPDRVVVLEEDEATRANILDALDATCARARAPGSRTFIYFSGHGGQGADGASYILPVDARRGHYRTTAISARELAHRLAPCAGELTVVLDCCRAAAMEPPELAAFGDPFRCDIQARGRVVLAASRGDGNAYASPDADYGIFTGHLLDGLRGAASADGGDVTVAQLFDYLQQRVVLSSSAAQRPAFIAHTEAFYPLTRYPRPVAPSPVFEKDVYLSYDRGDAIVRDWVASVLQPAIRAQGCTIWDHDDLGYNQMIIEQAIVRSRYVVAVLTAAYLEHRFQEFTTIMAALQAIDTRTPRLIPVLRELFAVPLWLRAFAGLDMTARRTMELRYTLSRLTARLKKPPHER